MQELSPMLFASCVEPLTDPVLYRAAYESVPLYRREKTERFRFSKDKRRSLGAELLLRYALREFGISAPPDEFRYGEQGKPFLPEENLCFNLSHSGEWVICAVARCEIGCDVEQIAEKKLRVANRFFTQSEYEHIAAQGTEVEQTRLFYRYWTLKESFMKATGLGLQLPMDAFEIQLGEDISVRQSVDNRSYFFSEYAELPGYCCSVCSAGERPSPGMCIVDMRILIPKSTHSDSEF